MAKTFSLESLEAVVNSAFLFRCAPDWRLEPEWGRHLNDYDLWYVTGGVGQMTTSDGPLALRSGTCLWMRPDRRYEATHEPDSPLRVTAIHFDLRTPKRLLRAWEFVPAVEVFEPADPGYFEAAMAHVVHLRNHSARPEIVAALLRSLLLEMAHEGLRKKPDTALDRHHQEMLQPIIALLREHPEKRHTVPGLAARTGYSTDHFVRLFRRATGDSPTEFIVRHRIERAVTLLKESSHTVTQIADLLGYEELGYFSRQFKARMGSSPDHFRREG